MEKAAIQLAGQVTPENSPYAFEASRPAPTSSLGKALRHADKTAAAVRRKTRESFASSDEPLQDANSCFKSFSPAITDREQGQVDAANNARIRKAAI